METVLISVLCILVGVMLSIVGFSIWRNKKTSKRKSRYVEFSKRILIASYIIAVFVILYTMYIVHLMVVGDYTGDPSSLNTLIMLTLGELGAANSFYFWKARTENIEKIRKNNGSVVTEEIKQAAESEEY